MSSVLVMNRPEEADEVAGALLHACPHSRVFALRGELGAGKTTLIKAFCRELGVQENTASPSFAIVNEYHDAHNESVYHFDLFRLKDKKELEGIGFDEYLDSGHYCFVEWPELAAGHLPPDTVRVDMRVVGSERTLHIEVPTPLPAR
jgi:tRNA threonylcarbamoyladenosine biosynthesis protein TsaE